MEHDRTRGRRRVLFVNRSYWPDAEATGQLLTELCEDLADQFDVTVLAGQPNANPDGVSFERRGWSYRRGVAIRRVRHTQFSKRFLLGRTINYFSFLVAASVAALRMPRPEIVVVETDPPLLALVGRLLQRRGARLVVYLQDLHPDIAVAVGKLRDGPLVRRLRKLLHGIYRGADRVVVLNRDMQQRLVRAGVSAQRLRVIPNWIDTTRVQPKKRDNRFRQRHGLDGQFLVMYSGNLGLCQRLEDVLAAAEHLHHRDDVLFVLVGAGVLKSQLERTVQLKGLSNVRFLPYEPKGSLSDSLSAADVHLVPVDPRVADCLMPSKFYGVLASGTPLVAVAPEDCELSQLTRTHRLGAVAAPGQPRALAGAILALADRPGELPGMGARARRLAERSFDRRQVTARFADLLHDLPNTERQQPPSCRKSQSTAKN